MSTPTFVFAQVELFAAQADQAAVSPAYRLGIAQQVIRTALRIDDLAELKAYLADNLTRIDSPEVAA